MAVGGEPLFIAGDAAMTRRASRDRVGAAPVRIRITTQMAIRYGEEASGNDAAAAAAVLAPADWQITVEDVRGGFPLAADLPPDDHVLAGVGLRSAVGRNR